MSHATTAREQTIKDPGGYALVPEQISWQEQALLDAAQTGFGPSGPSGRLPSQGSGDRPDGSGFQEGCRGWIGRLFVQSDIFQMLIALVIICNCVIMGLETDYPEQGQLWNVLERICLGVFTFEISMRMIFFGEKFLYGNDVGWNILDLCIVVTGILDTLMGMMDPVDAETHEEAVAMGAKKKRGFGSLSVIFRAFRLLRILRVVRLFKMLTQLYTLVMGFLESLVSVFWVSVLATLCLFICGVFLTRTLGRPLGLELLESKQDLDGDDRADAQFYLEYFGSVPTSMFTLFTLMATPDLTRMRTAMDHSLGVTLFFIGFIVFGSFAMISILTGVISESMVAKGQMRRENMRFEEEEKLKVTRDKLRTHFKEFDTSGDGLLSRAEFQDAIPSILELLAEEAEEDAVYKANDLLMVYDLMDLECGGEIDTEEFLAGMEQFDCRLHQVPLQIMKFQATLMKRHNSLSVEVKGIQSQLKEIHTLLKEKLDGNLHAREREARLNGSS